MTIDKYTKAVLTVIAAALVGLLFKDAPVVSTAYAQSDSQITDVNIVQIAGDVIPGVDPRQRSHAARLPIVVKQWDAGVLTVR